jgi:hypothetical protein
MTDTDLELVVAHTSHERYRELAGRPEYAAEITRMAHAIRAGLDPFTGNVPATSPGAVAVASPHTPRGACVYLGLQVLDSDSRPVFRECKTCQGSVRAKVFACHHPDHTNDPTTTFMGCLQCLDYEPDTNQGEEKIDMGTLPVPMVPPSQRRPGIYRGGILQIMVTRACDLSCYHCTQGSNLAVGKPVVMTPDQFDQACASLEGYFGVVGVFGGNPTMSPYFEDYCRIMRGRFPFEQRGLWTNNLRGKGGHARITFNPKHSNFNVHLNTDAYDEFCRDWPESIPYLKGRDEDSKHLSPWRAMNRWPLIGRCDINRWWSAMVCVVRGELRAFFCEIAGAMAMLHQDNPDWDGTGQPMPDTGLKVEPDWWRKPMADFEPQARLHCNACGIPLGGAPQWAIGGEREEFSETHRWIARPKAKGRPVAFVGVEALTPVNRPATEYLPGTTPRLSQ